MVFFGLISYSLYLWHWPLLALERATHAGEPSIESRVLICIAAVALAWLSFRFVERPLRRPDPATPNRKIVVGGVIASAALAFASTTLGNVLQQEPPPNDPASRTARDMPANRVQCNYRGDQSLDDFPRPGCNSAEGKPVRVVIWGDSHALAWQPLAWAIGEQQGAAAASYTRDACGPALGFDNGKHPLEAGRCREFNRLVAARIEGIDTLIISANWPDELPSTDFNGKFAATIQQVAPRVKHIILLGPTPFLRDSVPACIAAHNLPACAVPRSDYDARSSGARALLRSIAAKYTNVEYVELGDFFCDAEICPAMKEGYGLYWDSNHVASTAARMFSKEYLARKADSRLRSERTTN
jgi:hypothetical protein